MANGSGNGNGKRWWLSVAATVVGAIVIAILFMAAALPAAVSANAKSIEANTKRIEGTEARMEKALGALHDELSEQRKLSIEILKELKK